MRETLRRFLRSTSWPVPAAMLALMAFGILAIGVSERAESVSAGHMTRQIVFACIGVLVFVGAAVVPKQVEAAVVRPDLEVVSIGVVPAVEDLNDRLLFFVQSEPHRLLVRLVACPALNLQLVEYHK